ncbi:hypothetical protein SCLARK_00503 [Spiroplasma clarkii]|nr:M60 family metallopeptidase [Spiroplasma clarkii]ARU91197.1 hypothetical protein SCLARK_00503 [Spiroplasma clarkii]
MYGRWTTSFDHILKSTRLQETEDISIDSVETQSNAYVLSFSVSKHGILFHHIASTLFIEKVLVNGIEKDPSRTNLIYNRDPKSGPVDTNYGNFWNKLYEKLDTFRASGYDVTKQLTKDTPIIVLKSEKFNLVIDTVKMFLIMETAKNDGILYNDNNLNSALLAMDWNYNLSNEINGLSSKGLGDYNFEYDFQKENIMFSDHGPGLFYSTSKYFAMHSSLGDAFMDFEARLTNRKTFYKESQFTSSFTGKGGVGFKKPDAQATENIVEYFSQGMWGLQHEFGHTFQVGGYKLGKWGEVTVNIGPVGITQLLYKYNLVKPVSDGFYDQIYERSGFKNANPNFISSGIRQNALYENSQNGINYDASDATKFEDANGVELIFITQLMYGLGSGFIPALNNYYRHHKVALNAKTAELKAHYTTIADQYSEKFNPEYHAKLDILIDAITRITRTNLNTFFKKWGLEVPQETRELAQSYGRDLGTDLFKVILDKNFSGINNSKQKWFDNMSGGFLIEGIAEKLKQFSEWGIIGDKPVSMKLATDKVVEPVKASTDIDVNLVYQNAENPNIYYASQNFLDSQDYSKDFPHYLKIRGVAAGNTSNGYSVHLWVNSEAQKVNIQAFSSWIGRADNIFAIVSLFDEKHQLVKKLEIESKKVGQIEGLIHWDFNKNYTLQVEFKDDDFKLDEPNGDGSKIFNHENKRFEPISNVIPGKIWEVTL